jgi:hypothetical protein
MARTKQTARQFPRQVATAAMPMVEKDDVPVPLPTSQRLSTLTTVEENAGKSEKTSGKNTAKKRKKKDVYIPGAAVGEQSP